MNDGFISLVSIWCLLIIIWSGWFDSFFQGNRHKRMLCMIPLVLWLLGHGWKYPFSYGEIWVLPVLLPIVVATYVWVKEGENNRLHIVTASFLVGVSVFFMQMLFHLDPVLMFMDEKLLLAGFTVLLIMMTARRLSHQWILFSFALGLSDLCFQLYVWQKSGFFSLGNPFIQDIWWMTVTLLFLTRSILYLVKRPIIVKRKRVEATGIARIEEIK